MASVIRDRNFAVPIEALYRAITDFEKYPEFLPEVVGAKRLPGASDTHCQIEFELEVMKRFQYTLDFSMKAPNEIRWKLTDSNFFKTNQGAWILKPSGNQTEVHYELEVSFGFLVPGWISKKLTEVSLPKMFESFEMQAKKYL